MGLSTCDRGCQTLPKAKLQKVSSAPLLSWQPHELYAEQREPSCELEERESCPVRVDMKKLQDPQDRSAATVTILPRERKASCPKQEGATWECVAKEDLEEEFLSSDRSVKEPCSRSATRNEQKRTLGGYLTPVEWIRSHPKVTLVTQIVLLLLVVALAVSLAAVSGRMHRETPVTAVTAVTPVTPGYPLLPACPSDWVGYNGICYFLSRDHLTWNQAQARCSELGASLAVLKDWEMEFLFHFSRNVDYWLGLCTQDQRLQWVNGSNFNSSFPVLGNAPCVFLAEHVLRSGGCSNHMQYLCSRAQTHHIA